MTTDVIPYEQRIGALSVQDVQSQVNLIQHVMRQVMKKDEHYGVIPGTGNKPTLLKAGAEKLCLTFRLDPQYEIEQKQEGAHLTIVSKCTLFHIPTSQRFGSGMGSCSTRESKYAYRNAAIKCPHCHADAVIKGKEEYGGGWVCFKKKGGCGAKFSDGDEAIEKQPRGRVANEDLADTYNTVLKMANKRSLVAAVLNATAASDIFTQDIEDMPQASGAGARAPEPVDEYDEGLKSLEKGGLTISKDQVIGLGSEFSKLDAKAEADFLRAAKIERIDALLAADYEEAMDWIRRRKQRNAKAAATA